MSNLPELLAGEVAKWRGGGYACDFPLIGEILRFQRDGEAGGGLRYLRSAQFAALETYWHLRLVRKTASVLDIYRDMYPQPHLFVQALGVPLTQQEAFAVNSTDDIVEKIKNSEWARQKRLDALHEAATLPYPGYIFALAMGAGKTVLIGSIIATEFAMAMHYERRNDGRFMQNALVFAPGKTIIESLREIAAMPLEKILPTNLLRRYQAEVSMVFPRDGQKEIGVIEGGTYNIIVSNTEKIALRAVVRRRNGISQLKLEKDLEQKIVVANARLKKIISLPNLGVFSDEAHHTYGNDATEELKRVRRTVNYIHENKPLVAAVNTTGTPYYRGQMLPDVVFWYGLRDGIRDNVLKSLRDGIVSYNMKDPKDEPAILGKVVNRFYEKYGDVRLPNGAAAKIAFYFRSQEHLEESRPHIQKAMAAIGKPMTEILVNTQKSSKEEKDDFNRLNEPTNQKRVILLVQIGTEGWNCPSLFACALIRKQTKGVFVLQSATRCLRQVGGNEIDATIYLSAANRKILERELQANFGHGLEGIKREEPMRLIRFERRKMPLPKLDVVREIIYSVPKKGRKTDIKLIKPAARKKRDMAVEITDPDFEAHRILQPDKTEYINLREASIGCYVAAAGIAANYHLDKVMPILEQLKKFYPGGEIPGEDVLDLMLQVEKQTINYEYRTEKISESLELLREKDDHGKPVFTKDGKGREIFTMQFSEDFFDDMREAGLIVAPKKNKQIGEVYGANLPLFAELVKDGGGLSYHYFPYCFASAPELDFFSKILRQLNTNPEEIETFIFTGMANSRITNFWFFYQDKDGAYHRYFPDFLLVKKSGDFHIVEIKGENKRDDPVVQAKAAAIRALEDMPENRFRYTIVFAEGGEAEAEEGMREVRQWIENKKEKQNEKREN